MNLPSQNMTFSGYPFGMTIQARSYSSSGYRYSFNGKETDEETGNQDYGFRIYNPRTGKFLSEDPITMDYPWFTPYQFAGNKPIWAIDLDGLEDKEVTHYFDNVGGKHKTIIKTFDPPKDRGYGTLHKYIKHDLVFDKKRVEGNMTYYDHKVKNYKYKADVWEPMPWLNIIGQKMDDAYNRLYRVGIEAGSGGLGVQGKGQLGIFALSAKLELFGNDEHSGGINFQIDFSLVGSAKGKDGGVTFSVNDWYKVGLTGQAYAFLNSKALPQTELSGARENSNYFESSTKFLNGGMGLGGTFSQNLSSQSTQYRVGPILDASLDLSKGLMRSGKSSVDAQLAKKYTLRFTTGQATVGQ